MPTGRTPQAGIVPTNVQKEDPIKLARNALHLVTALAISAAAATVSAAPVTLNFAGSLTSSFGSLNSGDPFSGSYTFDPLVAATGTSSFAVFNDLLGATLSIGSFSATIGPGTGLPELQQDNVAGADRYALVGSNPVGSAPIGGLNILLFGFRLDDTTGTAISDALTLLNSPSLASFTSNTFFIFLGSFAGPFQSVSGTLDRLGPTAVPEPGTLALLLAGLVALPLAAEFMAKHRRSGHPRPSETRAAPHFRPENKHTFLASVLTG